MDDNRAQNALEPIAVIGMAGRFPKSKNLDEFWQNLRDGVECITFFTDADIETNVDPDLLKNPNYVKAYGVMDGIEMFDAAFFNMSPRDARVLDPQHRVFLECAWEAMENAGYDAETYLGKVGVFAGTSWSSYLFRNILPNRLVNFVTTSRFEMAITNHKDTMPMRVSFFLNLKGPSVNISTTCSTSLIAVHYACRSLLMYECDMVMAGASFVRTPQKEGHLAQDGMIWSFDGHCRPYDASSKGIVPGNGVGIIVLKRLAEALEDGDHIHAVILATAANNDGSTKVGYTAPSIDGQADAIAQALALAGVESDSIGYVEGHGTGTELGDPVEIASMTKAFREMAHDPKTPKKQFCGVGSVKSNIGHLNHAAGMSGLLKTILGLKHKQIPPSLHFKTPNPKIDFANSPFYVNATLRDWPYDGKTPRRAGVNAFGIGGTNAHVVLQEAPVLEPSGASRPWQLVTLSAKTSTALDTLTQNLARAWRQQPDLNFADAAHTLHVGRHAFNYRRIVVSQTLADAVNALEQLDPKQVTTAVSEAQERSIVFMFPGQGSQYVNMGQDLYATEPTFRATIDRCAEFLVPRIGVDLRTLFYPPAEKADDVAQQLQQTAITQPALFVMEYAVAQLWMEWGIRPHAMIGHSLGEYVAACLAGVFSLEDALALVAERGRLMQSMPAGAMLAAPLPPQEIEPLLGKDLSLALINSPGQCVVAGTFDAVNVLEQQMTAKGLECRRLHTSHAFHSAMMDPIVGPFTELMQRMQLNPPQIPFISNVTGDWITADDATDPGSWARALRQTVRFADGLQTILQDPQQILLEVGPGRTLSTFARQHPAKKAEHVILTSMRHPQETQPDVAFALTTLGKLWLACVRVDWAGFVAHERRYRVPLPTYPFERKRYWIDIPKNAGTIVGAVSTDSVTVSLMPEPEDLASSAIAAPAKSSYVAPRNEREQKIAAIWQEVLGVEQVGIYDDFYELGGSSFIAGQLVARLCEGLGKEISVRTFLSAPTIAELSEAIK
jgi:phthiocerol/phenolphthiocerol synthesis type-I polyketide synthase E